MLTMTIIRSRFEFRTGLFDKQNLVNHMAVEGRMLVCLAAGKEAQIETDLLEKDHLVGSEISGTCDSALAPMVYVTRQRQRERSGA